MNRLLHLREKLTNHEIQSLLQKVVQKCIQLSKKFNIQEYMKQANMSLIELAMDPETTVEKFKEAVNKLKVETSYDIWLRMGQVRGFEAIVKLQPNKRIKKEGVDRDSYVLKLVKHGQMSQDSLELNDSMQFNGLSQTTEKWNPLTFAVYSGNLELIKCIISKTQGNSKRMLKIPGIFKSQEVSRLFPFIMAIRHNNLEMFKFFWEDLSFVYSNEDTFDRLFRLLAKHEKPDLISYLLSSQPTMTLFQSMSYSYRLEFIDHVLQIKSDILKELNQQVIEEQNNESSSSFQKKQSPLPRQNKIADSDAESFDSNAQNSVIQGSAEDLKERMNAESDSDSFDPQEFLFEKKQSLDHFFFNVYDQFSKPPYSLQFYLSLPKFMVRQDSLEDFYFELMRKTLKNISEDEIEVFLFYDTEAALSIVTDLIDKNTQVQAQQKVNKIDKEIKNLAVRIKKSQHYTLYKSAVQKKKQK